MLYSPLHIPVYVMKSVCLTILFALLGLMPVMAVVLPPVPLAMNVNILVKEVTGCHGDENGFIIATATGGTAPYSYSIDNGGTFQPTGEFYNLPAGNYPLFVKDNAGQTYTRTVEIVEPQIFNATGQFTDVFPCQGDNNGTITVSASGGTTPYLYSVNGGPLQSSNKFLNLPAGEYTVYAEDDYHCHVSLSLTIDEPDKLIIDNETVVSVETCFGDSTGSISVSSSGGGLPHNYALNGGASQAETLFDNLPAGGYLVTVSDAVGCSASKSYTLTQPLPLEIVTLSYTDVACYGKAQGELHLSASGGTGAITYSPNGIDNYNTSGSFTGLTAGTYKATARDTKGCKADSAISITQPTPITATLFPEDLLCNGLTDGLLTIEAQGGTGSLTFSLDSIVFQVDTFFNDLAAGSYNLWIRDASQCVVKHPFVLDEPPALIADSVVLIHPKCKGDKTGLIHAWISGGTWPYNYSIDAGETFELNPLFEALAAGSYPLVVRDGAGCLLESTRMLNEPALYVQIDHTDNSCYGEDDGRINITVSGDQMPFIFSIDSGATFNPTNNFTPLKPGYYDIVLQSATGCQYRYVQAISEPDTFVLADFYASPGCNNQNKGSFIFTPTGGTVPFRYSINGGLSFSPDSVFANLSPGLYPVLLLDANNCRIAFDTSLVNPPKLLIISRLVENLDCYGLNTGALTIMAEGGVSPLGYSVDNGQSFQSDNRFEALGAGTYQLVVRDTAGCTVSSSATLTQPQDIVITVQNLKNVERCFGDLTGSFTAVASGGTGGISFSINQGASYITPGSFSGLAGGNYTLLAKDQRNCADSVKITISQPNKLLIDNLITNDVSGCSGDKTGRLTIEVSGGTEPYRYSIDSGFIYDETYSFTSLYGGLYHVFVKDVRNCRTSASVVINEPLPVAIEVSATDASCAGDQDGLIEVSATGGSGKKIFSIDGGTSFPSQTGYFDHLTPGIYTVVVKDANECRSVPYETQINNPLPVLILSVETTDPECNSLNNGSVTVSATGGTGSLVYYLEGFGADSAGQFKNIGDGTFEVRVEDAKGCHAAGTAVLHPSDRQCIEILPAFTPNGDGMNDLWSIAFLELYSQANVQIYDRHGKQVGQFRSGEPGWDGTFNGKPMPMDTYWYFLDLNNGAGVMKGYFSLVR